MENCSTFAAEIDLGSDFEFADIPDTPEEFVEAAGNAGRPTTPAELIEAAGNASKDLLPKKSNSRYKQAYDRFQEWKQLKGATSNSERVLLAYFSELMKTNAPTTLWAKYSMLKSTLNIFDKVDISPYGSLIALLKQGSKDHEPKQAKIFTESELQQFLDTAPDVAWLDVKVVVAFGLSGACRTHELPTIRLQDIGKYDDMYYVTVPRPITKTRFKDNSFAITGGLLDLVRKYASLRPGHATTDRFFLNFQKGKCTVQTIGKAKFYLMPRRIAEFLQLPNPHLYTGHSIRRSSVTVYANTGANIEALKRHSGHRSTKVCESYIDNSKAYKKKTGDAITKAINFTSTSNGNYSFASQAAMNPIDVPLACTSGTSSNDLLESAAAANGHNSHSLISAGIRDKPIAAPNAHSLITAGIRDKPTVAPNAHSLFDDTSPLFVDEPVNVSSEYDEYRDEVTDPLADSTNSVGNPNPRKRDRLTAFRADDSEDQPCSQVSTQNFLAQVEKRFSFHKCNNLTINFNK